MKYEVIKHQSGSLAYLNFPEDQINNVNLYLTHILGEDKYKETIDAIEEVTSGKKEKKLLTTMSCEVLIQKDMTEIEFTPDVMDEDELDMKNKFSNIPTEKFKEAVEIWWKEYSSFHKK